jgi:outer membrane receptor protein involved in Fe transport
MIGRRPLFALAASIARIAAADPPAYESKIVAVPDTPTTGGSTYQLDAPALRMLPGAVDRELPEALRALPGVTGDALGQNHVRGNYEDVAYWLDGVPLPAALSNQLLTLIPTELVSRVDLTVGGMPVEYGGVAGAAAITTILPESGQLGYAKLTYGSNNTVRPSVGYAAAWGRLRLLVAGSYEYTERGLDTPDAIPIVHDQAQTGQLLVRAAYSISSSDRIETTIAYRQSTLEIPLDPTLLPLLDAPPGTVRGPDRYGNDPPRYIPLDANPIERERDLLAIVGYRHRGPGGNWLAAAVVRSSQGDLGCDPVHSLGATADPGSICSDVSHGAQSYRGLLHYWVTLGRHDTLKIGIQGGDEENRVDYTQYTRDDAAPAGGPDPARTVTGSDRTHVGSFVAFAQDHFRWGALTLLAGVRFDLRIVAIPGQPTASYQSPSARLGATYDLGRVVRLHASVGYLWQPPSLDAPTAARALGLVPAGQPLALDVRPESDWSAEVGLTVRPRPWLEAGLTAWGRLMDHPLDDEEIGNTDLKAEYNYQRGRAGGLELELALASARWLTAFGNLSLQVVQGQNIATAKYLFDDDQLAYQGWQAFDHQQVATFNLGADLHDGARRTHLSALVRYGSGMRTGQSNQLTLPQHVTVDVSLRHLFDLWGQPEVAIDLLNAGDELWAYRIGNASVVGSAYAPLHRIFGRVTWHLQ